MVNNLIDIEARKKEDVLWLDFKDSYHNLSLKNYGFLKYAQQYCPDVKCVLQIDNDAVANIRGIEKLCDSLPGRFRTGGDLGGLRHRV